jgi:ABC-2 type transport system permease protein
MFNDIKTMIWKEIRVQFRGRTKKSSFLRPLLAPVVLAGVFPITWGADWVNEFPPLIIAFITPALIVGIMIPDSFAGERERHTLDTLLASRLPDRAVLFGKMLLPVLTGWGAALGFNLISLIVVNLAHGGDGILFYSPQIAGGILFLSFLSATLMAGGGVLTSISATSAQEAAQKLMMFILVPAMLLQIIPMLFMEQILKIIKTLDGNQILIIFGATLLMIDLILIVLAIRKFQRSEIYLTA